jgi:hypothetical protein
VFAKAKWWYGVQELSRVQSSFAGKASLEDSHQSFFLVFQSSECQVLKGRWEHSDSSLPQISLLYMEKHIAWEGLVMRTLGLENRQWKCGKGVGGQLDPKNWPQILGSESVSKVEDLLLPDGQGWNEAKLRAVFFEKDVDDIMRIPVGRAGSDDYIAWNYTKDGVFQC